MLEVATIFVCVCRPQSRTERHVFLLDGLALCCKQKPGGVGVYRLKEKINMRKAKLIDMEESDGEIEIEGEKLGDKPYPPPPLSLSPSLRPDLKFSFQLVAPDQQGFIFYAISKPEKNEWMAALTHLLTRRYIRTLLIYSECNRIGRVYQACNNY